MLAGSQLCLKSIHPMHQKILPLWLQLWFSVWDHPSTVCGWWAGGALVSLCHPGTERLVMHFLRGPPGCRAPSFCCWVAHIKQRRAVGQPSTCCAVICLRFAVIAVSLAILCLYVLFFFSSRVCFCGIDLDITTYQAITRKAYVRSFIYKKIVEGCERNNCGNECMNQWHVQDCF